MGGRGYPRGGAYSPLHYIRGCYAALMRVCHTICSNATRGVAWVRVNGSTGSGQCGSACYVLGMECDSLSYADLEIKKAQVSLGYGHGLFSCREIKLYRSLRLILTLL